MKTINKANMQTLRAHIAAHMATLDIKALGLQSLTLGNATFDPNGNFTFKLAGVAAGGLSPEASAYETLRLYEPRLPPVGTRFDMVARTFIITGAKQRSEKINVTDVANGKPYVIALAAVLRNLPVRS